MAPARKPRARHSGATLKIMSRHEFGCRLARPVYNRSTRQPGRIQQACFAACLVGLVSRPTQLGDNGMPRWSLRVGFRHDRQGEGPQIRHVQTCHVIIVPPGWVDVRKCVLRVQERGTKDREASGVVLVWPERERLQAGLEVAPKEAAMDQAVNRFVVADGRCWGRPCYWLPADGDASGIRRWATPNAEALCRVRGGPRRRGGGGQSLTRSSFHRLHARQNSRSHPGPA